MYRQRCVSLAGLFGGTGAALVLVGCAFTLPDLGPLIIHPPTADAGPDQNVDVGERVTLIGLASTDPDDDPLTSVWQQRSGPAVLLENPNSAQASFVPTEEGTYEFTVTVTDGTGGSDTSTTRVFVGSGPRPGCPRADAGVDQQVSEGAPVVLRGANSADPAGGHLTYEWNRISGPQVSVTGVFSAEPTFAAPQVDGDTNLQFELTVTNESGCPDTDSVIITVRNRDVADPCATVECQNDGLFCNGVEACVGGRCESTGNPCASGETCDESTDSCISVECTSDSDCDDDAFCNGPETCVNGRCVESSPPCAPTQTCDEDSDACLDDEPSVSPSARYPQLMWYDLDRQQVGLWGGWTGHPDAEFIDLWHWNGSTWEEAPVSPACEPLRRRGPSTCYDEGRQRIVIFGGRKSSDPVESSRNDTWEVWWDPSTAQYECKQVHDGSGDAPTPRGCAQTVYDSQIGRCVLFGGQLYSTPYNDTWTWNGFESTWTRVDPGGEGAPSGNCDTVMAYDEGRGAIVLYTGSYSDSDTWEWNGDAWTLQHPTNDPSYRHQMRMVYDGYNRRVLLFGGGHGMGWTLASDTWAWDGAVWTQILTQGPSGRVCPGMVYDPVRRKIVLFGGAKAEWTELADTWEFEVATDSGWVEVSPR